MCSIRSRNNPGLFSTMSSMTSAEIPGIIRTGKIKGEVSRMKGFTARSKLSRKARRSLDLEKRRTWEINPVTRVRESGKHYNRNAAKAFRLED